MKLYRILKQLTATRCELEAILCYVAAQNDEAVYDWLRTNPWVGVGWANTCWEDYEKEEKDFRTKVIKNQGDHFTEADSDSYYYGVRNYRWELVKDLDNLEIDRLKEYLGDDVVVLHDN